MVWGGVHKKWDGEPVFESDGTFMMRSKFFPAAEGVEEKIVRQLRKKSLTRGAGEAAPAPGERRREILGHPPVQGHSEKDRKGEEGQVFPLLLVSRGVVISSRALFSVPRSRFFYHPRVPVPPLDTPPRISSLYRGGFPRCPSVRTCAEVP